MIAFFKASDWATSIPSVSNGMWLKSSIDTIFEKSISISGLNETLNIVSLSNNYSATFISGV